MPLWDAREVAEDLLARLLSSCERIEIAGSIRREKPMVSDIELVAVPRIEKVPHGDIWSQQFDEADHLQMTLGFLELAGTVSLRRVAIHRADGRVDEGTRDGQSYKALEYRGMPVDLFIVRPPADWGVIYALRTGPGDWNTRIVTDCQRYLRRVANGQVWRAGKVAPCPEERDFFVAVGQRWVEPRDRRVELVDIRATTEVPA